MPGAPHFLPRKSGSYVTHERAMPAMVCSPRVHDRAPAPGAEVGRDHSHGLRRQENSAADLIIAALRSPAGCGVEADTE